MNYKPKILIIDDDSITGNLVMNFLQSKSYDVCLTLNGAIGIQKAFEYHPDLILCDIKMDAIDGFQVFGILKESMLLDKIPFIFITGNSEIEDVRNGLDLGADDYFIKPLNLEKVAASIEKRLCKYKKIKEQGRNEFRALANISPNGIFLFEGLKIIESNPSFHKILSIPREQYSEWSLDKVFDIVSLNSLMEKMNKCQMGLISSLNQKVNLKTEKLIAKPYYLYASVYERNQNRMLMIGLLTKSNANIDEENYLNKILTILKKENIAVPDSVYEQFSVAIKSQEQLSAISNKNFFSKRETEVLHLSMEGLPTKLIADRLSISDRTVEKHRANLMEKTNSKNIIEVITFAIRKNLIDIM